MDIYIDDVCFIIRHSESFSREDILHMVKEEMASKGSVLTDIVCMGESLDESDFLSIPDAVEVYFTSSTEEGILSEVLEQVISSIDHMKNVFDGWIDDLSSSSSPKREEISDFREDLSWVIGVLEEASDSFNTFKVSLPIGSIVAWSDDFDAFLNYVEEGAFQEALLRLEEDLLPELTRFSCLFKELCSEWEKKIEDGSTDQL